MGSIIYSGKKKKHTLKTQVLVTITGKILALDIDKGRTHDFKVFKQSKSSRKITASKILADSGYVGIHKLCPNAIPFYTTQSSIPIIFPICSLKLKRDSTS